MIDALTAVISEPSTWLAIKPPGSSLPLLIRKPVDNRLWNTSSWVNYLTKRDRVAPKGWDVEI